MGKQDPRIMGSFHFANAALMTGVFRWIFPRWVTQGYVRFIYRGKYSHEISFDLSLIMSMFPEAILALKVFS